MATDFCTHQELDLLLKATAKKPRARVMVLLLAEAGLLVNELCRLTWADLDFRARTLTVPPRPPRRPTEARPNPSTSRPKPRLLPISPRLSEALAELLEQEGHPASRAAYVFESPAKPGEPISRGAVNKALAKLRAANPAAGGESGVVHPAKLRKTFSATLRIGHAATESAPTPVHRPGPAVLPSQRPTTPAGVEQLRQQLAAGLPAPTWGRRLLNFVLPGLPARRNQWVEFDTTRLVGREAEGQLILETVAKGVSVLVVGGVGVGKTHLLDTLSFGRPVLEMSDTKDFKKSLAGILLYLFDGDKEAAGALFYKDLKADGKLVACVNKETVPSMCKILLTVCQPGEYVLKIGDIDGITPTVVRALEMLKDHFVIVTTSRGVKAQNAGFIWNFERLELLPLSRAHTLRLVHYLTEELDPESKQYLANKVWDTSEGNPRMVQELCGRFRKEPTLTNVDVADICGNYIGKQTREIDMSIFLLILFGGLSLLRYVSRESHNTSLRFIGGVAMVLLMFGRFFFNASRRKSF